MAVGEPDRDGSVEVTGKATTPFEAYRTLLRDAAEGLATHYLKE